MSNRVNHYSRAEEKFAKAVILYADSGLVLHYDSKLTKPVHTDDMYDLFMDRAIVSFGPWFMTPIAVCLEIGEIYCIVPENGELTAFLSFERNNEEK